MTYILAQKAPVASIRKVSFQSIFNEDSSFKILAQRKFITTSPVPPCHGRRT